MEAVVVEYEVQPEFAEKNAANIRAVMAEMRQMGDAEIQYQSFRMKDDTNRFVHIGFYANDEAKARMTSVASFKVFQTELRASKPVSPPQARWLDKVGSSFPLYD